MKTETGQTIRLDDYRPTDYAIETVRLDLKLDPKRTQVTSTLSLAARDGTRGGTPLTLDGDALTFVFAELDGKPLSPDDYVATPDAFTLKRPPEGLFELTIGTETNPEGNSALMGLFRSSGTYCTQCEPEGFRRITYFLDRPDVLSVYTTRLEGPKDQVPVLLSNGNPIEEGELADGHHYAVWHDPYPKPSYLFAAVAGNLAHISDTFVTASGRTVDLRIYVEPGKEDRCHWAMDSLKRSMRWDEVRFGREYDLDIFMIVAVSDFNMGAMENKGLNVFNDKYILADPTTATDTDYAGIESVIAHEYFHNWTGDRITCRDWFQLCLKEGLTVFRDQEFTSDERSRPVKRISDVRTLKAHQFPEDAGPLAHPVRPQSYREINNFYTATVYEKGAEIVRMLATRLGEDGFRAGMDLYFERHDGEAATIEDFLACFAEATDTDLDTMLLWYNQAGTPTVTATSSWDAGSSTFTLKLTQNTPSTPGQSEKAPMPIPIRFGLVGPNGDDMEVERIEGAEAAADVLLLSEHEQTVVFHGIGARPVPSLLRGFSAPVRLEADTDTADLLFLLAHDSDPFNRWNAAQTLAMDHLKRSTEAIRRGDTLAADPEFIKALETVATDTGLEPAYRALALQLPAESDVFREIATDVDPAAVSKARTTLKGEIGSALAGTMRDLYDTLQDDGPYHPDPESTGRRALSACALDYLVAGGTDGAEELAKTHFDTARNMTDRLAALSTLAMNRLPSAEPALEDYAKMFEGDALAMDKWLSMQAMIPQPDTLDRVRELMDHPAFSIANPNRVRALIGAFATGNATGFHRADGAGYHFIANIVIELDPKNPQVAARLLAAFRSWRSLEEGRRTLARQELERVAERADLSRDSSDIVSRMLG
ncbi:aminopeptidase N [Amorphus orientalis]|uniref:Aminopeptidase N n=1 Tax=Amorphus orientalis TaxID=649198 RepID=A0AAE3VMD6_9HYPH|nr:aminopeptidase N [Amorphus orientalis]MDQ0314723.1 aminopeptidase N [Amorphus orientalis]